MNYSKDITLPHWTLIGFTGHRRVVDPGLIQQAVTQQLSDLLEKHQHIAAFSSFATGADTIFVEACFALDIPWIAVSPLPLTEFAHDFTPEEWLKAKSLLAKAREIEVLQETGGDTAYLECGCLVAEEVDILLAVWNGQPASGVGGTTDVISFARRIGKPVTAISVATGRVEILPAFVDSPAEIAANNSNSNGEVKIPAIITQWFEHFDAKATAIGPDVRRYILYVVLAHTLATVVAAAALAFHLEGALSILAAVLKCSFATIAIGIVLFLRFRHAHHDWITNRIKAEFFRSVIAVWPLPTPLKIYDGIEHQELNSLVRMIRFHQPSHREPMIDLNKFKTYYLATRLDSQCHYYRKMWMKARRSLHLLLPAYWIFSGGAVGAAGLAVAYKVGILSAGETLSKAVSYFMPIALPALASWIISWIAIQDLNRRFVRYDWICQHLEQQRTKLRACFSWALVSACVEKTERKLLNEVLEWHSSASHQGDH